MEKNSKESSSSFPEFISFTLTNACNLRCRMCGQWSEEGYIYNKIKKPGSQMKLEEWKHLADEASNYKIRFILIRGGEPFLYPGIIKLLEHIHSLGIFISIDTNGTVINKYAEDLVRIGNMHITFSVDGPERIHDEVRRVKGSFKKIKENIHLLNELEQKNKNKISKSICFTISKYNYEALSEMPAVARSMGINSMNIVPYYYFSEKAGISYEKELERVFNGKAFSWKGFHQEGSGINFNLFINQYRKYLENLEDVYNFPYMNLNEEDYKIWFNDSETLVGSASCMNIEKLIDIQPDGRTNFCVDFPDFSIGNVKQSTIKEIWNSPQAENFRNFRRKNSLAICNRCGAKYISEIKE